MTQGEKRVNLLDAHPELQKYWHPTKNGKIKFEKLTTGSSLKVWWVCDNGHEYERRVYLRITNSECPVCKQQEELNNNTLADTYPQDAKMWHPKKNGSLKPSSISSTSSKEVWWKCTKGHEFKKSVARQTTSKVKCPICEGKQLLVGFNDLATTHPEVAKRWHPENNGDLKPIDVTARDRRYVIWSVGENKTKEARICDMANKKIVDEEPVEKTSVVFAEEYPELAAEWNYEKNGDLTPDAITPRHLVSVWWKCKNGHEWTSSPNYRTKNAQCPECKREALLNETNLAVKYPEIAKDWYQSKNGTLTPDRVKPTSQDQVWWKCENGHETVDTISTRVRRGGCMQCMKDQKTSENSLAKLFPDIASQWSKDLNGDLHPENVINTSLQKVWWVCPEGHDYETTVYARTHGASCPYCNNKKVLPGFNDLATKYPSVAAEWHPTKNGDLTPSDVVPGTPKEVYWINEAGESWIEPVYRRVNAYENSLKPKVERKERAPRKPRDPNVAPVAHKEKTATKKKKPAKKKATVSDAERKRPKPRKRRPINTESQE